MADRLVTIVEGLLALGRAGASTTPVVAVDLGGVARERVEQWEPLAIESGVDLQVEGAAIVRVLAVPSSLSRGAARAARAASLRRSPSTRPERWGHRIVSSEKNVRGA